MAYEFPFRRTREQRLQPPVDPEMRKMKTDEDREEKQTVFQEVLETNNTVKFGN